MNINQRIALALVIAPLLAWCAFQRRRRQVGSPSNERRENRVTKYVKPVRRVPARFKSVPDDFFNLLKAAIETSEALRSSVKILDKQKQEYRNTVNISSADDGNIKRQKLKGVQTFLQEVEINAKDHPSALDAGAKGIQDTEKAIAEAAISYEPETEDEEHCILPYDFFYEPDSLLDSKQSLDDHAVLTRDQRQRLLRLDRKFKEAPPDDREAYAEISKERTEATNAYQRLKGEDNLRAECIRRREMKLVTLAWPYVASKFNFYPTPGSEIGRVSRGSDHESMDDNVSADVEAVSSDYEDLMDAYNAAVDLVKSKEDRYEKLSAHYYYDLDKIDPSDRPARLAFDQQFYVDRGRAIAEIGKAERGKKLIKNRIRAETARELKDTTSAFGSVSGDGRTGSAGPAVLGHIKRRQRVERPYIVDFLDGFDEKNLVPASWPITDRAHHDDEDWNARSIEIGDVDAWSQADDPQNGEKIRKWREEMEELRRQFQD